jgi:CubicO group peptidase (beta-lactamase class C family)
MSSATGSHGKFSVIFLILISLTLSSCHVFRYVWWNYADIGDYNKFPGIPVKKSSHPVAFPSKNTPAVFSLPSPYHREGDTLNLETFLEQHKTVCFLIVRRDSIVYEHYFHGYNRNSVFPSFSISKSVVSALTGIAISEGKIGGTDQPITDYLPELKDPGFRKITLDDLLSMRSGLKFDEGYKNPFGEMAKFYYGLNLRKYTLNLKTETEPGRTYNYQSANTELVGLALEKATGMNLARYLEEKIWEPLGMEYDASWSTDSRKDSTIKAFCCINAHSTDLARFGQLFLHNGRWEGKQVVPEEWIRETKTIRYPSRDGEGYPYTYFWRVTEEGNMFAKGILGQYIYICPEKDAVIVRIGSANGEISWPRFIEALLPQL